MENENIERNINLELNSEEFFVIHSILGEAQERMKNELNQISEDDEYYQSGKRNYKIVEDLVQRMFGMVMGAMQN